MARTGLRLVMVIGAALLVSAGAAWGQLGAPFDGMLEPVEGSDGATGSGILYSVLDYYPEGPKLMVNGTFDGMRSAATVAHLHRSTKGPEEPGGPTPGPVLFDIDVSAETNGTLNGSWWITEEQAEELRQGWYYVQVHSEANPAGALRGWLKQANVYVEDSP